MSKPEKAWCVIGASGVLLPATTSIHEWSAIAEAERRFEADWAELVKRGFRCVKVTVSEGWPE